MRRLPWKRRPPALSWARSWARSATSCWPGKPMQSDQSAGAVRFADVHARKVPAHIHGHMQTGGLSSECLGAQCRNMRLLWE